MQGTEVQIDIPSGTDQDAMHEIAKYVESQANVAMAKVKIEKHGDDDPSTMVVELWGQDLHGVDFEGPLRSRFPALAQSRIDTVDLGGDMPGPGDQQYHSDAEDPEIARQEIIDQMRADGIEGDIQVDVKDGPDGRQVEVKVRKANAAAPAD